MLRWFFSYYIERNNLFFKDLILHEQLGMEIAYFDRFQDALRPVHCAIMLRNVKILRALTERNLQFDQIQATCDRKNEKNFQKELLSLVSDNLSVPSYEYNTNRIFLNKHWRNLYTGFL